AYHVLVPEISSKSIYVAVGMLGATVMPHVVYLHSALWQHRVKEDSFHCPTNQWLRTLRNLHYELVDVLAAMNGAWLINSAMIVMAAAAFFTTAQSVSTIEQAHMTLKPLLGPLSASAFAMALLFSGLSSPPPPPMPRHLILDGFL